MYADFTRALAERDEDIEQVAERLTWKTERNTENAKREIAEQAAQCKMLLADLKKPEDSAAYQYAKRYLDEAIAAQQDKDETRRDYERRRVALENEYHAYMLDRLEWEKQQATIRKEKKQNEQKRTR